MIKFLNTKSVEEKFHMHSDQVRYLLREGKLCGRKLGGTKGDYIINPVDVSRIVMLKTLLDSKQDPSSPDMLWVQAACEFLANEIKQSGFDPTLVVGIAFGGLVPAAYISSLLRRPFCTISAIHYSDREQLSSVSVSLADLYVDDKDHVLVVDDVSDSGETLLTVKQKLLEREVLEKNIRFATLHKKTMSQFEPDWFVTVIDDWIKYPWEESS